MESKYDDETSPDPIVGDCVDPNQMRFWLQDCENNHGIRCNISEHQSLAPLTELRFIDVIDYCVVNKPPNTRYFALSYMWGGIEQLQLTIENGTMLSVPTSLQQHWTKIPAVIQDAIQFVAALKERYLWVDSLCIVQDDARMKHHQILQMGGIYNSAIACLVSAAGNNANSGLAGIRPKTRKPEQKRLQYQNVYLIEPGPDQYTSLRKPCDSTPYVELERRLKPRQFDFNGQLLKSSYNSRAWTYQERLLSRRCIYFMENMAFFHCRNSIRGENKTTPYSNKTQDIRHLSLFKADPIFSGDPFRYHRTLGAIYTEIVTEYRRKQLTFPSDSLNAFAGIGAALERLCAWRLIAGLPESLIEHALLWYPIRSTRRRCQGPENSPFPSWSWAGWDVEIGYENIYRVEAAVEPYLADMQSLIQDLIIYDSNGPRPIQSLFPANVKFVIDARNSLQEGVRDWLEQMKHVEQPKNILLFQALVIPLIEFHITPGDTYEHHHLREINANYFQGVLLSKARTIICLFCNLDDVLSISPPSSYDIVFLSIVKGIGEDYEDFSSYKGYMNVMLIRWAGDFAERIAVGRIAGVSEMAVDQNWKRRQNTTELSDGPYGLGGTWKIIRLI